MSEPSHVRLHVSSVFFYEDKGPEWTPPDVEHFRLDGMVFAGPEPDGPVDGFDFQLCTPSWLAEHFDEHTPASEEFMRVVTLSPGEQRPVSHAVGSHWFSDRQVLFGRGLIFVRRWDRAVVERAVAEVFARVAAPTWQLAADRVGRIVPWEFAYQHDARVDTAVAAKTRAAETSPEPAREPE